MNQKVRKTKTKKNDTKLARIHKKTYAQLRELKKLHKLSMMDIIFFAVDEVKKGNIKIPEIIEIKKPDKE